MIKPRKASSARQRTTSSCKVSLGRVPTNLWQIQLQHKFPELIMKTQLALACTSLPKYWGLVCHPKAISHTPLFCHNGSLWRKCYYMSFWPWVVWFVYLPSGTGIENSCLPVIICISWMKECLLHIMRTRCTVQYSRVKHVCIEACLFNPWRSLRVKAFYLEDWLTTNSPKNVKLSKFDVKTIVIFRHSVLWAVVNSCNVKQVFTNLTA